MHPRSSSSVEIEQAFAAYIASQWKKLDRPHKYTDRKCRDETIEFISLQQAYQYYHFDGNDRRKTESLVEHLSNRLRQELQRSSKLQQDSHKLHHVCLDILVWGGVERAVQGWLTCQCDAGTLRASINNAVTELCDEKIAPDERLTSVFQDGDAGTPMDAGMTKICALAKPDKLTIYDGRVGAGLGYLTVQFLRTTGKRYLVNGTSPPPPLTWAWGAGQTSGSNRERRNPTRGALKFASLRGGFPRERQRHATYMWRASRILRRALKHIVASGMNAVKLSHLEMAVFMIGYDVKDLPLE